MSFSFKQFNIDDSNCTMKIGTDAVLLGAIADCNSAKTILDIGTGSGIIALMLAQRSQAVLDAIEIDNNSFLKAKQNFLNSPWPERLTAIHTSFQDFSMTTNKTYDLIVSNPPFFSNNFKPILEEKRISKHDDFLDFHDLISGAAKLLSSYGKLVMILPFSEKEKIIQIAMENNLFLSSSIGILPKANKKPNRVILAFVRIQTAPTKTSTFVLRNSDNTYSDEYRQITKDFHPFY